MTRCRLRLDRALLAICIAAAAWGFSFGLGAPLSSLWLRDGGSSATIIGLNTAVYYAAIALAAAFVPRMARRWGRACPVAGMVGSALAVGAFPWSGGLAGYFALRFLHGVAAALTIIPLETRVNEESPDHARARNFGLYAFSMAVGWALGNLVGLEMYTGAPRQAFLMGGASGLFAAASYVVLAPRGRSVPSPVSSCVRILTRGNFLCFGSAWAQGFFEGGMVALLPVYLLAVGMTEHAVGTTLSGIMIGVIAFQVPVAWCADRVGRTRVLLGCYAAVALGLAALVFGPTGGWLRVWLFIAGACSGAFYPLGLAILGERVPPKSLPRASSIYLGVNCLGSLIGPAVSGLAVDWYGDRALFATAELALVGVFTTWLAVTARGRSGRSVGAPTTATSGRVAA